MKKNTFLLQGSLVLVIALISLRISRLLQKEAPLLSFRGVLCYLIPVGVAFMLYFLYQQMYAGAEQKPVKRNSKEKGSLYIAAAGGIFAVLSLISLSEQSFQNLNMAVCGYLFLNCFLTGVFEEIIFRGLIQNLFLRYFAYGKKRISTGIVYASMIFAAVHLFNLMEHPEFILGTFTQVIYTFCLGMLLGTSYFIRGSLYRVIFLHGIFNFLGQISVVFQKDTGGGSGGDISLTGMLIQLAIMLPCAVIAVKMLNKVKEED